MSELSHSADESEGFESAEISGVDPTVSTNGQQVETQEHKEDEETRIVREQMAMTLDIASRKFDDILNRSNYDHSNESDRDLAYVLSCLGHDGVNTITVPNIAMSETGLRGYDFTPLRVFSILERGQALYLASCLRDRAIRYFTLFAGIQRFYDIVDPILAKQGNLELPDAKNQLDFYGDADYKTKIEAIYNQSLEISTSEPLAYEDLPVPYSNLIHLLDMAISFHKELLKRVCENTNEIINSQELTKNELDLLIRDRTSINSGVSHQPKLLAYFSEQLYYLADTLDKTFQKNET